MVEINGKYAKGELELGEREITSDDYEFLGEKIYGLKSSWANTGVIYLPMEAGGQPFGEPLKEYLEEEQEEQEKLALIELPIGYDRQKRVIYTPQREEILEANERFTNALNLIFDDVTGEGKGALTAYGMLLTIGIKDKNIKIGTIIDNVGITGDLHIFRGPGYDNTVDRMEKLKELYKSGMIREEYIPNNLRYRRKFFIPKQGAENVKKITKKFFNSFPTLTL